MIRRGLYFAYGSNVDHAQMVRRVPSATFVDFCGAEGWRFDFSGYSVGRGGGVGAISEVNGATAYGALWSIEDDDDLANLDLAEGYSERRKQNHYTVVRLVVSTKLAKRAEPVWTYTKTPETINGNAITRPSAEYYHLVRNALMRHSLTASFSVERALCRSVRDTLVRSSPESVREIGERYGQDLIIDSCISNKVPLHLGHLGGYGWDGA